MSKRELKNRIKKAEQIRGREYAGTLEEANAILAAGESARRELDARENAQLSIMPVIEAANQTALF